MLYSFILFAFAITGELQILQYVKKSEYSIFHVKKNSFWIFLQFQITSNHPTLKHKTNVKQISLLFQRRYLNSWLVISSNAAKL